MPDGSLRVVQFIHPGFEYSRRRDVGPKHRRSGMMQWKPGLASHDRKFMLSRGSAIDPSTDTDHVSAELAFWGEWEGPSVYWRVESPGKPLPSIAHAPFRPNQIPTTPVQNTDPMVFGESFIYSNCMQRNSPGLRSLAPGSIILFGRASQSDGEPTFSLDTCLVVGRLESRTAVAFDEGTYGNDLLRDAVLGPLDTENIEDVLSVYFGKPPDSRRSAPFSFFPAKVMHGSPPLFPRPELRPEGALEGVINPRQRQGIKFTSGVSTDQRDEIWREVVAQVGAQGCVFGYHASPPPLLDASTVERMAQGPPHPTSGS